MADPRCRVCDGELHTDRDSRETSTCAKCRDALGVEPMGEPTRPPAPCRRCNGKQLVRAIPREHTGDYNRASPMVVTHAIKLTETLFGKPTAGNVEPAQYGRGRLELYICRACGFVEWYCQAPDQLPIGPHFMTQLLEYESDGPYR